MGLDVVEWNGDQMWWDGIWTRCAGMEYGPDVMEWNETRCNGMELDQMWWHGTWTRMECGPDLAEWNGDQM